MMARKIVIFFVRPVLAVGFVLSLAGCERKPTAKPTLAKPVARFVSSLPDYVLEPIVNEAECELPNLRIVSAAPSVTEICSALGLRETLVGRTRYCDYPPGIEAVSSIGALIDVNVEVLLALRPDLILVSGQSRSQIDRLKPLDLRIETVPDAKLDDLFAAIARIGELTSRPRTAAALCESIRGDLARVAEQFADAPRRRVLLLTGTLNDPPRPPYVAGPGSFYDVLLKRAGHENVVPGEQGAFAPLSLEFIIRADPEIVVELDPDGTQRPHGDADALATWSKIGALRAVGQERVHVLTGNQHYLLGPRIARTFEAICRAIAGNTDEQP